MLQRFGERTADQPQTDKAKSFLCHNKILSETDSPGELFKRIFRKLFRPLEGTSGKV